MKFETLTNKKKRVGISIGIISVISVIGITAFTLTRANYKQTQSVPLIKGNISYNKSDLEIVAIKLQQDDGTYTDATNIPSSGYKLNDDVSKSYCKVGGKTEKIDYHYLYGILYLTAKEKGTKCYLTFDKGNAPVLDLVEDIIASNGGRAAIKAKGNPDFSKTSCKSGTYNGTARTCEEDTTGLWAMEDDNGISYYFRGSPTNNYVKFGKHDSNYSDTTKAGKDMYWRIIRINGDGSIRLIYDGSEYHVNGTSTTNGIAVVNQPFSGKGLYNNTAYVGYTYALGNKRGKGTDSNAKVQVDSWYTTIGLSNYSNYLSDSGFCGDRTSTTTNGGVPNNTGGTGTTETYYGAYYRLNKNKIPTLKCATINYGSGETGNKADVYTVDSLKGNGELTYPIGMITADEVAIAGGVYDMNKNNYGYYLYNRDFFWTMSPPGIYGGLYMLDFAIDYTYGIRPVINIDPTKINNVSIDSNGVYVIS